MTKRLLTACAAILITLCAIAQTTHTIASGETLYRLTKTYGVTAEAICAANPGLSAANFKTGTVIRIPAKNEMPTSIATSPVTPQQTVVTAPKCRTMHKVAKKETLYSIARQYGVTIQQLIEANDLLDQDAKLKKGAMLCIPYTQPKQTVVKAEPTNEELMPAVKAAPQKHINMAVLLPLKVGDTRSQHMLEFYRGVLMAVDSIKHYGVSVDVHAIEAGTTAQDIRFVIASHPELKNMDFIIGPQPTEQIDALSDFARDNKVRLVMPFATHCTQVKQNPYIYTVTVQNDQLTDGVTALALDVFNDHNIVVVHVAGEDANSQAMVEALKSRFTSRGDKVRTLKEGASEAEMMSTFHQFRNNLVLVPGNSQRAVNQIYPLIDDFAKAHPEYKFSILGFPEWQNYTSEHLHQFYAYDTYLYATSFRNPLSQEAAAFERRYTQWIRRPMALTTPRFGLMGFDVAWYFLRGISLFGAGLETHHAEVRTAPYQHTMRFERVSNWGGFINHSIKFIHYKPSQAIDLIEKKRR